MDDDTLPLFSDLRAVTRRPPRLVMCGHCRKVFLHRKGNAPHLYCSGACYHAARTMTPEEKFWQYAERGPDCWIWRGTIMPNGYGVLKDNTTGEDKLIYAHRLSYELHKGPIPPLMTIDHVCRVRACVNPGHLRVLSRGENTLAGENIPAWNKRKTHCKRGHPLAGETMYLNKRGHRMCLVCGRLRKQGLL